VKVDVVVLAGGDGAVIDPSCRFKGLLPVAGKPMVEWVVDAMRSAELVAEVAVVVPTAEDLGSWADRVDKLVVSDGDFIDNVLAGVRAFRVDRPVLVTTGDLPALTGDAVDEFLEKALRTNADFVYPLVRREDVLAEFPDADRTFVRLVDGPVTGGNMLLLNPSLVEKNASIGQTLFDTRKSALQMARVIGFRFVLRLLLGKLEVHEVEKRMGELLGGSGAAVYTSHASIGADVDKPVDVVAAERALYEARHGRIGGSDGE